MQVQTDAGNWRVPLRVVRPVARSRRATPTGTPPSLADVHPGPPLGGRWIGLRPWRRGLSAGLPPRLPPVGSTSGLSRAASPPTGRPAGRASKPPWLHQVALPPVELDPRRWGFLGRRWPQPRRAGERSAASSGSTRTSRSSISPSPRHRPRPGPGQACRERGIGGLSCSTHSSATAGPRVSRIAFGNWSAGGDWGAVDRDAAIAATREALDLGITLFDTARAYGFGAAEQLLGEALQPEIRVAPANRSSSPRRAACATTTAPPFGTAARPPCAATSRPASAPSAPTTSTSTRSTGRTRPRRSRRPRRRSRRSSVKASSASSACRTTTRRR